MRSIRPVAHRLSPKHAFFAALAVIAAASAATGVASATAGQPLDLLRAELRMPPVPNVAPPEPAPAAAQPAVDEGEPKCAAPASLAPGLMALDVPGHLPAVVNVPRDLSRPRPVVVVAHGAADRPEDQCEAWARVFEDRAFLLCTRGSKVANAPTVFEYISVYALRHEAELGLRALAEKAGAAVDVKEPLYAGFSLGAVLGVHVLAEGKLAAKRAILIEGGADRFTRDHVGMLETQGFDRVLFACGETDCPRATRPAADALDRHGIVSRIVVAQGLGHRYGGAMMDTVRAHLDFVVGDDPRFAP